MSITGVFDASDNSKPFLTESTMDGDSHQALLTSKPSLMHPTTQETRTLVNGVETFDDRMTARLA